MRIAGGNYWILFSLKLQKVALMSGSVLVHYSYYGAAHVLRHERYCMCVYVCTYYVCMYVCVVFGCTYANKT